MYYVVQTCNFCHCEILLSPTIVDKQMLFIFSELLGTLELKQTLAFFQQMMETNP